MAQHVMQPLALHALLPEARPEQLGRDHDLVAQRGESLADEFLVDERPVYLRGVEERDAALGRRPDHRDHLVPVSGRRPVALAHAHAAEPDGRDLQAAAPEYPCPHNGSP